MFDYSMHITNYDDNEFNLQKEEENDDSDIIN